VYWCLDCRSSLAEAEVEYEERTDPSIDVRFQATGDEDWRKRLDWSEREFKSAPLHAVIWTTTPWTLPANRAITVHPEFDYSVIEHGQGEKRERLLLASDLVASVLKRAGVSEWQTIRTLKGAALENLRVTHPFNTGHAATVPIVLAGHVTLDAGTGLVHTAPGHGHEDYAVGIKYGLEIDSPVGADGRFLPRVAFFAGQNVFEANAQIAELLHQRGALLHTEKLSHSYPHCWRHKTPVIFRATPQWFISMDQAGLRETALAEIRKVNWTPSGRQRMQHDRESPGLVTFQPAAHKCRCRSSCIAVRRLRCCRGSRTGHGVEQRHRCWFDLDARGCSDEGRFEITGRDGCLGRLGLSLPSSACGELRSD
jgi:isoleucyl-tRNA synthetase